MAAGAALTAVLAAGVVFAAGAEAFCAALGVSAPLFATVFFATIFFATAFLAGMFSVIASVEVVSAAPVRPADFLPAAALLPALVVAARPDSATAAPAVTFAFAPPLAEVAFAPPLPDVSFFAPLVGPAVDGPDAFLLAATVGLAVGRGVLSDCFGSRRRREPRRQGGDAKVGAV